MQIYKIHIYWVLNSEFLMANHITCTKWPITSHNTYQVANHITHTDRMANHITDWLTIDTFNFPVTYHVTRGEDLVHYEISGDVSVWLGRRFPGNEDFSLSHLPLKFTRLGRNWNIKSKILCKVCQALPFKAYQFENNIQQHFVQTL